MWLLLYIYEYMFYRRWTSREQTYYSLPRQTGVICLQVSQLFLLIFDYGGYFIIRKGILRAGDRILQVNGIDMRNASRNDADQLLVHSEGNCTLQIEYDVPVHGKM